MAERKPKATTRGKEVVLLNELRDFGYRLDAEPEFTVEKVGEDSLCEYWQWFRAGDTKAIDVARRKIPGEGKRVGRRVAQSMGFTASEAEWAVDAIASDKRRPACIHGEDRRESWWRERLEPYRGAIIVHAMG